MTADAREEMVKEQQRAKVLAVFSDTYTIRERLPWGGLVAYYLAEEAARNVVLAVLPVDAHRAPAFSGAFGLTTAALESIDSPHLLAATDSGIEEGMPYVEYEHGRGRLLADLLARGPLPSLDVLKIADQVLRALAKGHAVDLFHGDLTPHNILVWETAEGPEVKLLGLGLAQLVQAGGGARALGPLGSGPWAEDYTAPEALRGQPSSKSDIYSVGVLLHHMVVGHPPSGYETPEGFADIPDLPAVIRRAMARHPQDRFETALTMAASLDWLEVLSSQMSPHTQDIPLWMENSMVGSIPVPQINVPQLASLPAALAGGSVRPPALPGRPPSKPPSRPPPARDDGLAEVDLDALMVEIERRSSRPPSMAPGAPAGMASSSPLQQPLLSAPPTAARGARDTQNLMLAAVVLLVIIVGILGMALVRIQRRRAAPPPAPPAIMAPAAPVTAPAPPSP